MVRVHLNFPVEFRQEHFLALLIESLPIVDKMGAKNLDMDGRDLADITICRKALANKIAAARGYVANDDITSAAYSYDSASKLASKLAFSRVKLRTALRASILWNTLLELDPQNDKLRESLNYSNERVKYAANEIINNYRADLPISNHTWFS